MNYQEAIRFAAAHGVRAEITDEDRLILHCPTSDGFEIVECRTAAAVYSALGY